ncbi:MAG: hypothetical protein ABJK10_12385, partial [Rhodopirellula bahusiensis]
DVRWEGDLPTIRLTDGWAQLNSIDGIPIQEIMSFANEQYGSTAHKRFTEDFVEVVSKMGHDLDWEVELELQFSDGEVKTVRERMTLVYQRLAAFNLQIRTQYNLSQEEPDATE